MTVTRKARLIPTGDCFCGCGDEVEIGRWFVRGHDITAAAALRALEGRSLPERLVAAGYGPEKSVVDEAVARVGWERCPSCSYAGPRAGLAAHRRGCTADAQEGPAEPGTAPSAAEPDGAHEQGVPADPAAAGGPQPREPEPARVATSGAALELLLPGRDDPLWARIPLDERQALGMAARSLVTPPRGPLTDQANHRLLYALKAAVRCRMTGAHWQALLTAPRETLGSRRSQGAARVYEQLEELAARHLAPAAPGAAAADPDDATPSGAD